MEEKRFSILRRATTRRREKENWEVLEIEPWDAEASREKRTSTMDEPSLWGWLTPREAFGGAAALLALLALVLNLTLPWAVFEVDFSAFDSGPGGGLRQVLDRGDLREDSTVYTKRLLDWPIVSFIVCAAAGLGLLMTAAVRNRLSGSGRQVLQVALLSTIALFGLPIALSGARLVGDQNASLIRNLQTEETWMTYTLLAVPYVNLVIGLLLLAGGLYLARALLPNPLRSGGPGPVTPAQANGYVLAAVALGLLLMPLLPFAYAEQQGPVDLENFYMSERSMATIQENDLFEEQVTEALSTLRTMLWIVFFISLVSLLPALVKDTTWGQKPAVRSMTHLQLVSCIPLIIATVFLVLFYTRFGDQERLTLFVNPLLPLTLLATGAAYGQYLVKGLVPAMRNRRPEPASDAAATKPSS